MEIGSVCQNFRVTRVRRLEELDCNLWEMEHEKTGAQLAWLDRADENKTFGIAFKTLPEDSTGVFHILEHSVLCGSEKYPVKEPFVELLKSSVQTFLNAMTYPDKTVYPISSRNDQDYLNLLDVYMDAVLHPAIYHKPEIFRQEGWRYELQEDTQPVYQGVVFNEMKGAYASSDTVLEYAMNQLMFPDNCYSWESGGHPAHIPDLTYEQFIANHQKYYHPSNSRIMLAGSVDLEPVLAHIDAYLKDYERQEADFPIAMQQPVAYKEVTTPYEIGAEESPAARTILSCGHMLGSFADQEKIYAAAVLRDYLAGDNDAPLKQAILSAELGQDVKVNVHDGIQQPWVSWEVWNTDPEKVEDAKAAVLKVLTDLAENGLDRGRLEACYNRFAFQLRDRDGGWAPRSLAEALTMLDSWLYGGDPAQYLLAEAPLNALQEKLTTDYYRELIRELFLDNPHKAMAILVPSQTLGEEKQAAEAARIAAECAVWTDEDRARITALGESIKLWQQTPDSPEALATIPMLKLSDIDAEPKDIPVEITEANDVPVLHHSVKNGLVYANLYFDASDLSEEELSAASMLASVLGELPTKNHSSAELQMLLKQKIGKFGISAIPYAGKTTDECKVRFLAKMVVLPSQSDAALDLIHEILTETDFSDKTQLRNLINQAMMQLQMAFVGAGHQYGFMRALASQSAAGAVREAMNGSTFISWIKELTTADDAALEALIAKLEALAQRIFVKDRLVVSVSENADELAEKAAGMFPAGSAAVPTRFAPMPVTQVGLPIPAPVGFAVRAANYKKTGNRIPGSAHVLANILDFNFLWNEIRVQGGAYGCGFVARDDGDLIFYSYRDPQPVRSLDIYHQASAFLRSFCEQEDLDLTPMILGALANADPLLNAEARIAVAEARYLKGTRFEDVCRVRQELISTTREDLLALCDMLDALAEENSVCVVAGQPLLDACGEKLAEIKQIL